MEVVPQTYIVEIINLHYNACVNLESLRETEKNTISREFIADMKRMNINCNELEIIVQDRVRYSMLAGGLCSFIRGNKRE